MPQSVRWADMSGSFSDKYLHPSQIVKGCHEDDGTELAIARAMAREHMHIGLFTEMHIQLGKASSKLSGAYVMAGKKEVEVEVRWMII